MSATPDRNRSLRKNLLAGCALATALAANATFATSAQAQVAPPPPPPILTAFQGTYDAINGGASVVSTTVGSVTTDRITVNQPSAVINWTPTDTAAGAAPISFLAKDNVAIFTSNTTTNYTVLNRIVPTGAAAGRGISIDGAVSSLINDQAIGGNIWFYSPDGILIGSTGNFRVGGLVLTTLDHPYDPVAGTITLGNASTMTFGTASVTTIPTVPGSGITISKGGTISAIDNVGSYVAIVSPKIVQDGTVNVDGSVGYVAGEEVEIRMNSGYFSIGVLTGTGASPNPIIHSGTTGGPAQSAFATRNIYMTAVSKNDAITLLVGGTLGYEPAVGATVDPFGSVVLQAGYGSGPAGTYGKSNIASNISIGADLAGDVLFKSNVSATANNDILVSPRAGATIQLNGYAYFGADRRAELSAGSNETIIANGSLGLSSFNSLVGSAAFVSATNRDSAGNVVTTAPAGRISTIFGVGVSGGQTQTAPLLIPSTAHILVDGGTIDTPGGVSIDADGGNATLDLISAGSVFNAGSLNIQARGAGGNATANIANGSFSVGSTFNGLFTGGDVLIFSGKNVTQDGATATGGTARLSATGGTVKLGALRLITSIDIDPEGVTFTGPISGGASELIVSNSDVTLTGDLSLNADVNPGFYATGDVTGGHSGVTVNSGSLIVAGATTITADSLGSNIDAGATNGKAIGGSVSLAANGGTFSTGILSLSASATASDGSSETLGSAAVGGDAVAGSVSVSTANGGSILASGLTSLKAIGVGGVAPTGGSGTGGSIDLNAANGSISFGDALMLDASGLGGTSRTVASNPFGDTFGIRSGDGTGGSVKITVGALHGAAGALNFTTMTGVAAGTSLNGVQGLPIPGGSGGNGTGGSLALTLNSGTLIGSTIDFSATGTGGGGGPAFNGLDRNDSQLIVASGTGGNAQGGSALVDIQGGGLEVNTVLLGADGLGGRGGIGRNSDGDGGNGGSSGGGTARLNVDTDPVISNVTIHADATAGDGGFGLVGGAGGDAINTGVAAIDLTFGGLTITTANLSATATAGDGGGGTNGAGGAGGNASAGTTRALASGVNSSLAISTLTMDSSAFGGFGAFSSTAGNGGAGGIATGGIVDIRNVGAAFGVDQIFADTSGFGGSGGGSADLAGGAGADGTSGSARVTDVTIENTDGVIRVFNDGQGGDGGNGLTGGNGGVGMATSGLGGGAMIGLSIGNNILNDITVSASGYGGAGGSGSGITAGSGGNAISGDAFLNLTNGAALSAGSISIAAAAASGLGGAGFIGGVGGTANGGMTTGHAAISIDNSKLGVGSVNLTATAFGGEGGAGLNGTSQSNDGTAGGAAGSVLGGTAELIASGPGTIVQITQFVLDATGLAGAGGRGGNGYQNFATGNGGVGAGGAGGAGGNARGGTARVQSDNGAVVSIDSGRASSPVNLPFTVASFANGGAGGAGGTGLGGRPSGAGGIGGSGTGGTSSLLSQSGTFNFLGDIVVDARGYGGGFNGLGLIAGGGNGSGGSSNITLANTAFVGKKISVLASGFGGDGLSQIGVGGNGGNGVGGISQFNATGAFSSLDILDVTVGATGTGGSGGISDDLSGIGGNGGNGIGGGARLSMNFDPVLLSLLLDTSGVGGAGGFAATGGNGGDGAGGGGANGSSLELFGGDLTVSDTSIISDGFGGTGGSGLSSVGGSGGSATGGKATILTSGTTAHLFIPTLSLTAKANAGNAGISSDAGSLFANGVKGGNAHAGNASINTDAGGKLDLTAVTEFSVAAVGGRGNSGIAGGNGGAGGDADGGVASVTAGVDSALTTGDLNIDGSATAGIGGAGGDGLRGTDGANGSNGADATVQFAPGANGTNGIAGGKGGDGGNGGAGGTANGGSISIIADNGTFTSGNIGANVDATGGIGGASGSGGNGGNGGIGGNGGQGGPSFSPVTNSGDGGKGGNGGAAGNGGNVLAPGTGGIGQGGSIAARSTGGVVTAGGLTFTSHGKDGGFANLGSGGAPGTAGLGGSGGSFGVSLFQMNGIAGANGSPGANGSFGSLTTGASSFVGSGGTIDLAAEFGGKFTAGAVDLQANGLLNVAGSSGIGGYVSIANRNSGVAPPPLSLASLNAITIGQFGSAGIGIDALESGVFVTANSALTTSTNISINASGTGIFASGGTLQADAAGYIFVAHAGQPVSGLLTPTISAANANLNGAFGISAQNGTFIQATQNAVNLVSTFGQIDVDRITAVNQVTGFARLALSVNSVDVTGAVSNSGGSISGGLVDLRAGYLFNAATGSQNYFAKTVNENIVATVNGAINATGSIQLRSGGDIVLSPTAALNSNNFISLASGADVIVNDGAILNAALNVAPDAGYGTFADLDVDAGAIAAIGAIPADVSSFIVGNANFSAAGHAIHLGAEAIQAPTANFSADTVSVLIRNAPAIGIAGGNDGGLLTPDCVEGNLCIGNITATSGINLGPVTGTVGLPNAIITTGNISAPSITIRARDDISIGTNINPQAINASNDLFVASLGGNVNLIGAATLQGGPGGLKIFAASDINGPSASLLSETDIGLHTSGFLVVNNIDTAGVLQTIDSDGNVTDATTLDTGIFGRVAVNNNLIVRGGNANIRAGLDLFVNNALLSAGYDLNFNTLIGRTRLNATDLSLGGPRDINLVGQLVVAGDIQSTQNIALTGMSRVIVQTNAHAGFDLNVSSGGDIGFNALTSGGSTTLGGASISGGSVTAGSFISASTNGALVASDLTSSGSSIALSGTSISLANANAKANFSALAIGGDINLTGAAIAGQDIQYGTEGAGNISANSSTAGHAIIVRSAGFANLGTATTTGLFDETGYGTPPIASNVDVAAAGPVTLINANAFNDIIVGASSFVGTTLKAGNNIAVTTSGNAAFGDATAITGNINGIVGGGAIFTALRSGTSTSINAVGAIVGGSNATAGATLTLKGRSISTGVGSAGGALSFTSTTGGLIAGNLSGSAVTLNSAMTLNAGNIIATAGDIGITTVGAITTGDLTASLGSVSLANSLGLITTGTITAKNDFSIGTGSDLVFGGVTVGDDIRITTTGTAALGMLKTTGIGTDNDGDGSNIVLNVAGATTVTHAEAAKDFSATAASFATGLNTIITGGDININTVGDAFLGNSQAGGLISVNAGGLVDFATMGAGNTTSLRAGTSISGLSTTSGGDFIGNAGGPVAIGTVIANGTALNANQGPIDGNIFIISGGDTALGTVTAKTDIGIKAANITGMGIWTAGEDVFLLSRGTASIAFASAGDDLEITAPSGITLTNGFARGDATDLRRVNLNPGFATATVVPPFFEILDTVADGGDIRLSATAGSVSSTNLTAADDILVNASGAISISSLAQTRGVGSIGGASNIDITAGSLTLANGDAFTDLLVTSSGNADLGNAQAGARIFGNISGNAGYATLNSGTSTNISAIGTIAGGPSANAGTTLNLLGSNILTGDATAGVALNFTSITGDIGAGNLRGSGITVASAGSLTTGSVTAPTSDISLTAVGAISSGAVTANSGSAVLTSTTSGVAATGSSTVANDFTLIASGPVSLTSTTAGDDIRVSTNGAADLGALLTTGLGVDSEPDGANILLNTGALTLAAANAFSNLTINSLGLLAQSMQAGQSVQIVADGPISFTTLNAGADASVSANGAIDGTSVTTAGPLSMDGSLGITIPTINSGSAVTLDAFNGNILVATDLAALGPVRAFGLDVNLTALGDLALASADASTGNLIVQSGGALTVLDASASIGDVALMGADIIVRRDVTAGRNLVATTPGTLTIDSLATLIGTTITLNSSDIVIDTSSEPGQIGRFGVTTSVTLNNNGNRQTYVGGNGGTGTYGLSDAEAQLIFGDNITITAPRLTQSTAGQSSAALNTRAPDVILDTLTLSAAGATSGNFGANGIYRINTPGKLRTIGAVTFNNLGTGNRFEINAAEAIEIDAATGVISLRNPTNGLGGTLALTSQDVIAATLPAITDVIGAATLKAVSDRLAKNDGAVLDQGYLRADSIVVTISNGFYVQNSGAATLNPRDFDVRRGLTVGAGGLSINTGTNSAARIAINGQQMGASASATTGIDFLKLVSINGGSVGKGSLGTGLFDFASTINGCQILSIASCQVSFDNGNIARDVIGDIEASGYSNPLSVSLIEIKDVEKNVNEPIIDDPVTGAGNDDLWAVDDEKACDPAVEVCDKP